MEAIKTFILMLGLIILLAGIGGCSDQATKDEGTADRITTEAAQKMSNHIRTPIDKARATKSLGDQRLEEMDKALRKQ